MKTTKGSKPQIHIFYNFKKSPWGGGNQFLQALKREFQRSGLYAEKYQEADLVLFNSHHQLKYGWEVKKENPDKIIIYRLDGPLSLHRQKGMIIDRMIALFNEMFVDGIIFQSQWSKRGNRKLLNISAPYETIVHNAVDHKIFNPISRKEFNPQEKIKLIAVSWSPNWNKGFSIYQYLDQNLDFSKYQMTFVGNSPLEFQNIHWIKPVSSQKLAAILKQHDIYITASQNDPCSNALIEALACGLPVVALNQGGHPELVNKGGELFRERKEVIKKIEKIAADYRNYQSQITLAPINRVAEDYWLFGEKIYQDFREGKYKPQRNTLKTRMDFYRMKLLFLQAKVLSI